MKKIIIALLLLCPTFAFAQDRVNKELAIVSGPIATLDEATGWYLDNKGQWEEHKNEISTMDRFQRFAFHTVTLEGKEYLMLRKDFQTYSYQYPHLNKGYFTIDGYTDWIFDLADYKQKVENLSATDNVLVLELVSYLEYYPKGAQNDSKMKFTNPRKAKLVLKFRLNKEKDTARFLFYTVNKYDSIRGINPGHAEIWIDSDEEKYQIIDSDALYENFYYELPYTTFLDFIQAPLK